MLGQHVNAAAIDDWHRVVGLFGLTRSQREGVITQIGSGYFGQLKL